MQMINVLKKLAELDAQNPNIVKEDSTLEECGPMGMMDASQPHTPASINMTAGSGEELGDMLKTIMSLAGVHKVEPEHLGAEMPPAVVTAEPAMGVDAGHDQEGSAGDIMRSMMDKMNPDGEEETDEEYNNTPNDPNDVPEFDSNKFAYQPNAGDGDGENGKKRIMTQPTATMEQELMSEYKKFVAEDDVPAVDQGEYDQEGDMLKDNLMTIEREAKDLVDSIHDNENLPEWVEDKISQAKGMIVAVAEYMKTQHERGQDHDNLDEAPNPGWYVTQEIRTGDLDRVAGPFADQQQAQQWIKDNVNPRDYELYDTTEEGGVNEYRLEHITKLAGLK
jgi:hypothetical protein